MFVGENSDALELLKQRKSILDDEVNWCIRDGLVLFLLV